MNGSRALHAGCLAVLLAATAAAFLPVLDAGFVFDDDQGVQANAEHLGLAPEQLRWMATTDTLGHFQPLAWLSLALDALAGDMDPAPFHATNLLLHLLNAVLVYALALVVLRRGTPAARALPLAALGAALVFAVHPLRAEAVAWVTQRHTLLATTFLLAALIAYARRPPDVFGIADRGFLATLALVVLSLLCTTWAATLPIVLLVADVYPLGRWEATAGKPRRRRALLAEKLVLLVPALAALVLAALAQHGTSATRDWSTHGLLDRAAQAAYGLVFYPRKTLAPTGLAPLHPIGQELDAGEARFVVAGLVVAGVALAGWRLRRRAPWLAATALAYGLLLSPVLGFLQSGPQLVAERYAYVSCLPLALLAGAGLLRLRSTASVATLLALWLAAFVPTSRAQARVWHDSTSLWTSAIAVYPDSSFARYNLARACFQDGQVAASLEHFEAALAHLPGDRAGRAAIWQDAAAAYATLGRWAPARELWQRLLDEDPTHVDTLLSLGLAAEAEGRLDEALAWWQRALEACAALGREPTAGEQASCQRARALIEDVRRRAGTPARPG